MLLRVPLAAAPPVALQHRLLHGLSDPSRLRLLGALREGEQRVSDLVAETGLSQPNVSKHLACLRGCGLVAREKRGREVFYWPADGVAGRAQLGHGASVSSGRGHAATASPTRAASASTAASSSATPSAGQ
jgi:predicted ArsR family transcriptional regulator